LGTREETGMKLRELFENIYEEGPDEFDGGLKTIGVCFGRWNPPHRGHRAVWQAASKNPIWFIGTNENTSGPKDPLPYDIKLQCMAAVWKGVAGHVIPEQSLLTLASRIYEQHGENVHLKVYTDEDWLVKALTQYNGVEKEHGMYKFQQIDHVRTERLARATDLRDAVRRGDRGAFYKDAGISPSATVEVNERAVPVFDVVAHYLNQYPEKVKAEKGKKELAATEEFGVGKITAQNTTADVDASTPGKNLRAFKLAEHIAEIERQLDEANQTKLSKRKQQSSRGIQTFGDGERMSGDYTMNRLGMALAMTDGTNVPDIDAKSWIGKSKAAFPYTQEEADKLKKAYKAVGAVYKDLNHGDLRSEELEGTNATSPVATPKKNKYGV
jgi:hypothetical protein